MGLNSILFEGLNAYCGGFRPLRVLIQALGWPHVYKKGAKQENKGQTARAAPSG